MENMTTAEDQVMNEELKRPQFLTALCILSYIWSGIVFLGLIIALLLSGFIFEALEKIVSGAEGMPQLEENQMQGVSMLLEMGQGAFIGIIGLAILMYAISLVGVIKMWRLQKWGFYIYAGINGVGIILNFIQGSFFMPIIAIGFIIMYGLNLKDMKK